MGVVNVHLVDPTWPPLVVSGAIGLVSAIVGAGLGGWFVSRASRDERAAAAQLQQKTLEVQARTDVAQHERELLAKATNSLLDALWSKERALCEALHLARIEATNGVEVKADSPSLVALGRLELGMKEDILTSVPFIACAELRSRILTALQVVNDCYNIRGGSMPGIPQGGTYEHFSRAMIEVQRYFAWLRWNLSCALQGLALPERVEMPHVRRPLEPGGMWEAPASMPGWV